jgi:hypothetical protein
MVVAQAKRKPGRNAHKVLGIAEGRVTVKLGLALQSDSTLTGWQLGAHTQSTSRCAYYTRDVGGGSQGALSARRAFRGDK